MTLSALNRDHSRAHVRRIKEAGATHATVVDVVGVLKKVVNDAIRERPEPRDLMNPFERLPLRTHEEAVIAAIERQAKEDEEGPATVLVSPKVARAAMDRLTDPKRCAYLAVHLLAGLRLGEAMALTREQIDFRRKVIVIDRAVHVGPNGDQWVGLPKRNKIRMVAMCPTLALILDAHV